jgi:hypothetical protein
VSITTLIASALIAVPAANAALHFVNLKRRANKRRSAVQSGVSLHPSGASACASPWSPSFYGEWLLVKSATGSSSAVAWLATGIMAAIFAWVLWDCGVWLSRIRRSRAPARQNE